MKRTIDTLKLLSAVAALGVFGAACTPASHDQDSGGQIDQAEGGEEPISADEAYPLKVCVVSGEPLDSMGGPVSIHHEGVTVKFCCKSCIKEFKENPGKFMPKLAASADR